ncbi:hypothetical protein BMR02_00670 [Methylococcaceae bacterium HT1]|nr:hypothetical protein BMR02_00670 [Methylococcaceae bacterium HT1]TXL18311.1 hypothetical protein BMR04_01640 [Methylococcaceae bacterium HT3]TXL23293.1 hypothetical protein BMR03_03425 [Methylococcaceae bacterium HT2]
MFEILFILVVIYVAYVVYSSVNDDDGQQSNSAKVDDKISSKSPANVAATVKVDEISTKQGATKKAKPAQATQAKTKPKTNKLASPKIELRTVMMKNPATGEEAKVAGSYRMVKRWIKEALVEEGLLEKIYKNNELDDAAKVVLAEALSVIKAMDKYKV